MFSNAPWCSQLSRRILKYLGCTLIRGLNLICFSQKKINIMNVGRINNRHIFLKLWKWQCFISISRLLDAVILNISHYFSMRVIKEIHKNLQSCNNVVVVTCAIFKNENVLLSPERKFETIKTIFNNNTYKFLLW